MLYVILNPVLNAETYTVTSEAKHAFACEDKGVSAQCRLDWHTLDQVQELATKCSVNGKTYMGIDRGDHTSPRYDIIEVPRVGDEVSKSFNGDTYPQGTITHISKAPARRVIQTSTGAKFYRQGLSGRWVQDGTWALIAGHKSEQNPHF